MESLPLFPLSQNVYWSAPDPERDRPVLGAVLGTRRTLLVETGASPAHARQFLQAIQSLGGPAPRYAALTHWHWDHVFGSGALDLPTIAHRETQRRVAAMARLDWRDAALEARVQAGTDSPFIAKHVKIELSEAQRAALEIVPPDVIFDERLEIDLGGRTCQVIHVGGDHSPDSSIVFVPEERVVFLGDCLYSSSGPAGYRYTAEGLFPLLDTLEALRADTYLWGHHPRPYSRADFLAEAGLLRRTYEAVAQAGAEPAAAAERLAAFLKRPLNEDDQDNLEAFLTGMRTGADWIGF
ncbi:MAG: MBL fold metallo-hydrolase [Chloroflexi bacterium]|nr:MBL fold metallo-hydrolase [Chloroflexota bacterium]